MEFLVYYRMPESEAELSIERRLAELGNPEVELEAIRQYAAEKGEEITEQEKAHVEEQLARWTAINEQYQQLLPHIAPRKYVRICVREISYLDKGHYYALLDESFAWFRETFEVDIKDELPKDAFVRTARNFVFYRAEILTAIPRKHKARTVTYFMEQATVPVGVEPEQHESWEEVPIPNEWIRLDDNRFPDLLFNEVAAVNRQINANVLESMPDKDFLFSRRPRTVLMNGSMRPLVR